MSDFKSILMVNRLTNENEKLNFQLKLNVLTVFMFLTFFNVEKRDQTIGNTKVLITCSPSQLLSYGWQLIGQRNFSNVHCFIGIKLYPAEFTVYLYSLYLTRSTGSTTVYSHFKPGVSDSSGR